MSRLIARFGCRLALQSLFAAAAVAPATSAHAQRICVNSVGFLPESPKLATITSPCERFAVVDASTGAEIVTGTAESGPTVPAGGDPVWVVDFSSLQKPGEYRLKVEGVGESAPFAVSESAWNRPFAVVMRGMYLWRCGTAVHDETNGATYSHGPCHLDDALLDHADPDRKGETADAAGGWHDAGDYNKYVVNGAFTAGMMLQAWLHFEDRLESLDLRLPQANPDLPDYLDEVKWEIDWLLKMQAADGSVFHKVSTEDFCGFIMPEQETDPQYFAPWGSAATADLAAIAALASRVYRPYDEPFADRCLEAARLSYAFLQDHPADHQPDQSAFTTGTYNTRDADDRLWAAAELWVATGEREYLADYENRVMRVPARRGRERSTVATVWDWSSVDNLGVFSYLLAERTGRDPQVVERLQDDLIASADRIVETTSGHPFGRTLGDRYFWGCNGGVARQTMNLHVAHRLTQRDAYRHAAAQSLAYLFGRNPFARSFVTGIGAEPPLHPHDRRSGADAVEAPWPGYLAGGPWPGPADWHDDQEDYRTNEIAVNWNGALIYALAAFIDSETFNADSQGAVAPR